MWFFAAVLIAFGLIVAIDAVPFRNMWGYGAASGVFYVVCGAILIIAAATSPVFYSRREVAGADRVPVPDTADRRDRAVGP